ncbi:histone deacetylase family protein [Microvirga sp. M2]|uniref:histone deacetylase family protein n=1 Tax=Microvirga sp. M2 TaxID=3073270 RepID=UPI0039C0FB50
MRAIYSETHNLHAPSEIVVRGKVSPNLEVPGRVAHLLDALKAGGHEIVAPRDFGMEPILAIHDRAYVEFLQSAYERWHQAFPKGKAGPYACAHASANRHRAALPASIQGQVGYYLSGGSAPIDAGTFEASVASAHCALEAAALLEEGHYDAYALCRPPGHHAYADMAGGFCYLNNAAIAAQALLAKHKRVAILDFDVHHGNGTQDIFYDRDDVHFVSIHADPHQVFPFYAGYADERGEGAGEGFNLNLPVLVGSADPVYLEAIEAGVKSVKESGATALVVSVGFDAFKGDPSAEMNVSTQGFAEIGRLLGCASLPTALIQEGGYLVADLGLNLGAFMDGFTSARR